MPLRVRTSSFSYPNSHGIKNQNYEFSKKRTSLGNSNSMKLVRKMAYKMYVCVCKPCRNPLFWVFAIETLYKSVDFL